MFMIPLVDIAAQQTEILPEVAEKLETILTTGAFIGGPEVAAFEEEYGSFIGVRHCVGVANGTDALEMALRAVGVKVGDEVVVPANTFIATAEAVERMGARVVLVDVDERSLLMDANAIAPVLSKRTKAIVPVHLYGQAAPIEDIRAVAPGVAIVEDAAQSQGASRHGVRAGALGDIAATSFYPGKNLGAAGDAGAVLTDNDELAHKVRLLGSHGSAVKYVHETLGFNSRLDSLQAVVLRAKLKRLEHWNGTRRAAAARYERALQIHGEVRLPATLDGNEHVWHLYAIRVPNRDALLAGLAAKGVGAGIHYPTPIHLTPAFAHLGYALGDFPVSESAARSTLSLPLCGHISATSQDRVVDVLCGLLTSRAAAS